MPDIVALILATQRGDQSARAELAATLWPRVEAIIRINIGELPPSVDFDDLAQEAWLAFDRAVMRFDPRRGIEPVTYCGCRAIGAARDALRGKHGAQPDQRSKSKRAIWPERLGGYDAPDWRDDCQAVDARLDYQELLTGLEPEDVAFLAEWLGGASLRKMAIQRGVTRGQVAKQHDRILAEMRETFCETAH